MHLNFRIFWEFPEYPADQAHFTTGQVDFLKTGVIALYYSMIDTAMTV
jgi:hypothetical protein